MAEHCIWTGKPLPPASGGKSRKFINDRARAEAHRAARQYALSLIEEGKLTWDDLRDWDRDRNGGAGPYTRPGEGSETDG